MAELHRSTDGGGTVTIFFPGGREWKVENPSTEAYATIIQSGFSGDFILVLSAPGYAGGAIVLPAAGGEGTAFGVAQTFVGAWAKAK